MSKQDDIIFIKHFSWVIAGLMVFTVIIALAGMYIHNQLAVSENPSALLAAEERIAPAGAVYAGDTGREAVQEALAAARADQPAPFDGSTDGEMIYGEVCQACHLAGAAGAPKLEDAVWTERLAQGRETLVQHAIEGIGLMPAKGGRTDLTDEQVAASVDYMIAQVQ